jgi:hypothetical protein
MTPITLRPSPAVPALVAAAGDAASIRFLEFFAATIRNPNTRRAYGKAVGEFLDWCEVNGVPSIAAVQQTARRLMQRRGIERGGWF